jgi:hypothetical protein
LSAYYLHTIARGWGQILNVAEIHCLCPQLGVLEPALGWERESTRERERERKGDR